MPSALFAQATCTVNGQVSDCKAASAIGLAIMLPLLILGILSLVGWIIMMTHAIQHDVPNKAVWIVLMVVFNIGWIIYYFVVKRPFDQAHATVGAMTNQPPTDTTPPVDPVEGPPPVIPVV
jgi:Phospholipase_D-nuclease N-terminal